MDTTRISMLLLCFLWSVLRCARGAGIGTGPTELSPIPCNDKAVEKLSRLAVTYLNEDRADGYKFALNRISNVHLHAQGPAGSVYYLDLDVLETKCHIGSEKPWKRCDIRPFMETQISGNCNTTILHTPEGFSYLYSYDCTLVPDPPEKLQQTCPTCPVLLPVDSAEAVAAARLSLVSFKSQSTLAAGLGLKRITRAASQVAPAKASFVEFTVQECPEGFMETGTCQRLTQEADTETAGFCSGSVYGDMEFYPDVKVACEMFKLQNVDILTPVKPQHHNLGDPVNSPLPSDPGSDPQPIPSDPWLPFPAAPEVPADPAPFDPAPFDPAPVEPAPVDPTPFASAPVDPMLFDPTPFAPAPVDPMPFDPSVPVYPAGPLTSSSSESAESFLPRQQASPLPVSVGSSSVSSSEEIGGGVLALRPPFNFRYQKSRRRRRQALTETTPTHTPSFLSDFPSGSSPFRSCPGPSRYTTV